MIANGRFRMRPKSGSSTAHSDTPVSSKKDSWDGNSESLSKWPSSDDEESEHHSDTTLVGNSGGRNYTIEEMLDIWEDMKRRNILQPSSEKSELFHSIIANPPATLDVNSRSFSQKSNPERLLTKPLFSGTNGNRASVGANWSSFPHIAPNPVYSGGSHEVFTPAETSLVLGAHISWVYKDSSGVTQGPFDGLQMQEWYEGQWLQSSLLIRRVEEPEFYSLRDFTAKVENTLEPFLVPQLQVPELILPENTTWMYLDPNGVEQGPFDGVRMGEWYSMKWLQESLLIRRVEESEYYTLREFGIRMANFEDPFSIPQPNIVRRGYCGDSEQLFHEEIVARQREALQLQQFQLAVFQQQQQQRGWNSGGPQWKQEPKGRHASKKGDIEVGETKFSGPKKAGKLRQADNFNIGSKAKKAEKEKGNVGHKTKNESRASGMRDKLEKAEKVEHKMMLHTDAPQPPVNETKPPVKVKNARAEPSGAAVDESSKEAGKEYGEVLKSPSAALKSARTSNMGGNNNGARLGSTAATLCKAGSISSRSSYSDSLQLRHGFISWCMNSLQSLHSGVNQAELLAMLLSLPVSDKESKEIIAETIYSSSTTMDGRRFANEFTRRRKQVEAEGGSALCEEDLLSFSTMEEGPNRSCSAGGSAYKGEGNKSFQVVGGSGGIRKKKVV